MMLFPSRNSYDRSEVLRRAETFRIRGRVRRAIREYEKVLKVDPQDLDVHTKIAPLYIRARRKDEAKASLRRVIASYEKQGFVDKTIAMLRLALTLDRQDLGLHLRLAELYLGKSLRGDALRLLEGGRKTFRRKRFLREALIVEEKIDGTNVGIHFTSGGQMVLQCRGHLITEGMHPQYDLFKQWAAVKRPDLEDCLGSRFILFGEWVYARHSLHYRQLPH